MVKKGTVAKKGKGTVVAQYDYGAGVQLNGKKPYISFTMYYDTR